MSQNTENSSHSSSLQNESSPNQQVVLTPEEVHDKIVYMKRYLE